MEPMHVKEAIFLPKIEGELWIPVCCCGDLPWKHILMMLTLWCSALGLGEVIILHNLLLKQCQLN